jgi:hypothetical protein
VGSTSTRLVRSESVQPKVSPSCCSPLRTQPQGWQLQRLVGSALHPSRKIARRKGAELEAQIPSPYSRAICEPKPTCEEERKGGLAATRLREPKCKVYVGLAGLRLFPRKAISARGHLIIGSVGDNTSRQVSGDPYSEQLGNVHRVSKPGRARGCLALTR